MSNRGGFHDPTQRGSRRAFATALRLAPQRLIAVRAERIPVPSRHPWAASCRAAGNARTAVSGEAPAPFVPYGILTRHPITIYDDEWVASGWTAAAAPTDAARSVPAARPCPLQRHRDRGTLTLPARRYFMYTSRYFLRSGHGWAFVGAQKSHWTRM